MGEGRKVAAILAADVVGYSRLTGADEEATLARMRALRRELFNPTVEAHGGRVVKRMGDGVIVEFRSVVEAVRCAIEVTKGLAERNAGVPTDRRIEVRTGIHLATSSRRPTATSSRRPTATSWATASTSPRGSRGFASRAASSSRRTPGARCAAWREGEAASALVDALGGAARQRRATYRRLLRQGRDHREPVGVRTAGDDAQRKREEASRRPCRRGRRSARQCRAPDRRPRRQGRGARAGPDHGRRRSAPR